MTSRSLRALVLACLLASGLAEAAFGHAELAESDPADGETIETPGALRATFTEALQADGSSIVVRNEAGQQVARGVPRDDPEEILVELPRLPDGDYIALWTARGDDGHVTRGQIRFTVEAAAPTPTAGPATPTAETAEPGTPPPATAEPTDFPPATASPAPSPSRSPDPAPGDPTGGMTDVLLAVALAGAVIGGLALYLLRRT